MSAHSSCLKLLAVAAVGVLAVGSASAQDFGKLLERAVKEEIRQAIAPPRPASGRPNVAVAAPAPEAEPYAIRTRDGWTLVALRYRPTGNPRPGVMPVILCHGLTYNAAFWDIDPSCSFARHLAREGFDVWSVNLRGCGASQKWVWSLDRAPDALVGTALRRLTGGKLGPTGHATVDPRFANWTMDDHINHDVPALVHLVRRSTGAPEVAWVGHSMGGIVAICHLARYKNPGIGRLVTVGSQVTIPKGQLILEYLREMGELRQRQLVGQVTPEDLADLSRSGVYNMFFNVQNVLPKVYEALSGPATDVPSVGLMLQYKTMADRGVLFDAKGQYNYAQALGNITVPILISCGASDQFAPPSVQEFLYRRVGSTDKTLMIFGRRQGMSVDAGHDDALVGLNSRAEVYPVITNWLLAPPRTASAARP